MGAGVAQHAQGDLEVAIQAFDRAAQDALAAAEALGSEHPPASSALAAATGGPYSREDELAYARSDADMAERAERAVLARRTAVRALLALAGSLKQLGRLPEALVAARRAAELDDSVQSVHVAPLEAEIAAAGARAQQQ